MPRAMTPMLLTLLWAMLLILVAPNSVAGRTPGPALSLEDADLPSMFSVITTAWSSSSATAPQAMADAVDTPNANTIPAGTHDRILVLQDAVLDSAAPQVSMSLLPDVNLVVVWNAEKRSGRIKKLRKQSKKQQKHQQQDSEERLSMVGSVKGFGPGESMVTFVVSADSVLGVATFPETQVDGSVTMRTIQFESLPGETNAGVAYERFVPDLAHIDTVIEPEVLRASKPVDPAPETTGPAAAATVAPILAAQPKNSRRRLQQTLTQVDVLLLYTQNAAKAMGGTTAAVNKLTADIAATNQIYRNSDIYVHLNLLQVTQVQYTEYGFVSSLNDLQSGVVPGSAALRAALGADLVQLVTTDANACGIGFQMPTPYAGWGFSVMQSRCIGTGTSAHEMGHNFGCGHDYYTYPDVYSGLSRCDLGSSSFSTIMSYGCQSGARPARLFAFSNPLVYVQRYSGSYPTGDVNIANCAAKINMNAAGVAAYMTSTGSGGGGGVVSIGGGNSTDGTTTNGGGGKSTDGSGGTSTVIGSATCVNGVCPDASSVCSHFMSQPFCCPASNPIWCGGDECYPSGHTCAISVPETCVGGGVTCFFPFVCSRYNNQDKCCPISTPVWCGGSSCKAANATCNSDSVPLPSPPPMPSMTKLSPLPTPVPSPPPPPPPSVTSSPLPPGQPDSNSGSTTTCLDGSKCPGGKVCSAFFSFGVRYTCCSSDFPVWCGGFACYATGTPCSVWGAQ